jgi:hypothetical protein
MRIELFRRIGLTFVALAVASCTTDDLIAPQEVAGIINAEPTTSAASSSEQRCAGLAPPHTLFLRDARGNAFQLVLCRGSGWKYVAGEQPDRHERSLAHRKIKFSPIAEAQAATKAPPTENPMAVFIDGPTGFTFAWTSDGGWKYVGYLTDEQR